MSAYKKSGCKGKSIIFTYQHAIERQNEFRKRHGETLTIYRCNYCGFYHLGHKLQNKVIK